MANEVFLLKNYINKDSIKVGDYYINKNKIRFEVTRKLVSLTEITLNITTPSLALTINQGLYSSLKECLGKFGESVDSDTTQEDVDNTLDFFWDNDIKVLKSTFVEYLQNNNYSPYWLKNNLIFVKTIYTSYDVRVCQIIDRDYETHTFVEVKGEYIGVSSQLAKRCVDVYREETAFLLSQLDNIHLDSLKEDLEGLKTRLVII
jgi:hypothetical protein